MEVLKLGGNEGVPAVGAKAGDVGIDGAGKDVGIIMTGEIEASDPEVGNREEDVEFGEVGSIKGELDGTSDREVSDVGDCGEGATTLFATKPNFLVVGARGWLDGT